MTETAGDVALACMSALADELRAGGVEMVCVSPGSRSTPLALAFARHGRFDVRVHLDERSAAFFALGRAKATGHPAVLVCTSGTAAAEYLPAIVEASQSLVPLIALTADRPPELRDTGANQTIDQIELYGRYVRLFIDAGVPRAHPHASGTWRALARRALRAATSPLPGPVHLNLPFREPLTPTGAEVDVGMAHAGEPPRAQEAAPDVAAALQIILDARTGAILAGAMDGAAPAIADLATRLGWPLIAEPISGLREPGRALAAPQALLGAPGFVQGHTPDVIVQFGGTPTTRATQRFVDASERLVAVGLRKADPSKRALEVRAREEAVARALLERIELRTGGAWLDGWEEADRRARAALDAFFDADDEPFEPRVARDTAGALPDGSALVVASSTPVRDLDLAMAPRRGVRFIANRGASGIDGFVSTALGVASSGVPTYALTGDLSLLHDASGLVWSGARAEPVTFVVPNNNGGGIFDLLPSGELPENDALFVARHDVDLEAIATAARAAYVRVSKASEIPSLLASVPARTTVVEVPVDRARSIERRGALREYLEVRGL